MIRIMNSTILEEKDPIINQPEMGSGDDGAMGMESVDVAESNSAPGKTSFRFALVSPVNTSPLTE